MSSQYLTSGREEVPSSLQSKSTPTPLPIKRISILGLILAVNNTSIWMIFAFLPFMVLHFYPSLNAKELGFKAGLLGSAFSTGSLCGNFMWGVISDKIGRRPTLMYGLVGTAFSSLAFGFSPSYSFAIFFRFLWGFLNGNIGVSKTYMGEILDDNNASKGMALFGAIGGVGRTIGPIIGGFLAMPAAQYPGFKGTIFERYPFSLPCLVISSCCILILIFAHFQLIETLIIRKKKMKSKGRNRNSKCSDSLNENKSSKGNNRTVYISINSSDDSYDMSDEMEGEDTVEDDNDKENKDNKSKSQNHILQSKSSGRRRKLLHSTGLSQREYGLLSDTDEDSPKNGNLRNDNINNDVYAISKLSHHDDMKEDSKYYFDNDDNDGDNNNHSHSHDDDDNHDDLDNNNDDGKNHKNKLSSLIRINSSNNTNTSDNTNNNYNYNITINDKKNRHVSFAGLVMVKVIGSDLLAYGNLKKISPIEEPLLIPPSPPSSSSNKNRISNQTANLHTIQLVENHSHADINRGVNDKDGSNGNRGNGNNIGNNNDNDNNNNDNDDNDDEIEEYYFYPRNVVENNPLAYTAVLPQNIPRYSNGSTEYDQSSTAASTSLWATVKYLLTRREVVIATSLYGLNCFVQLAANEIFPLWVVTAVEDGGFSYTSHTIGIVTTLTGPVVIIMQIFVYPYLIEQFGTLKVYRYGAFLFAVTLIIMPTISSIQEAYPEAWLPFLLVTLGLTSISVASMWVLITIFVFINNSCYSHQRGTVNGIGQTFASLGRLSGPYIGANLFAWSETNGLPWPMDYYFTFYVLGLLSLAYVRLVNYLPRSIQRRKREPKEPRYAVGMMRGDDDEEDVNDNNDDDHDGDEDQLLLEAHSGRDNFDENSQSVDQSIRNGEGSIKRFEIISKGSKNSKGSVSSISSDMENINHERKDEDINIYYPSNLVYPSQAIIHGNSPGVNHSNFSMYRNLIHFSSSHSNGHSSNISNDSSTMNGSSIEMIKSP